MTSASKIFKFKNTEKNLPSPIETESQYDAYVVKEVIESSLTPLPEYDPKADEIPTIKGRAFVFTRFQEDPIKFDEKTMRFLAYGQEKCPKTSKLHYQGFVYFINERSNKALCKHYRMYMRLMMGTLADNEKYCSKDGKYTQFGEWPKQGQRKDLQQIHEEIKSGKRVREIRQETPMAYHQYGRTMDKLEDDYLRTIKRTKRTQGYWYWGETGSGKTELAEKEANKLGSVYWYDEDNGWWESYEGETSIIIDEFRKGDISFAKILKLTDKYPYRIKRRGRDPYPFTSEHVFITCPYHPKAAFETDEFNSIKQLERRFTIKEIKCLPKKSNESGMQSKTSENG